MGTLKGKASVPASDEAEVARVIGAGVAAKMSRIATLAAEAGGKASAAQERINAMCERRAELQREHQAKSPGGAQYADARAALGGGGLSAHLGVLSQQIALLQGQIDEVSQNMALLTERRHQAMHLRGACFGVLEQKFGAQPWFQGVATSMGWR